MTIVPAELRHTLDPGTPAQQRDVLTGLDEARQYVAAASAVCSCQRPAWPISGYPSTAPRSR